MVFLFGYDVPIVEFLFVMAVLMLMLIIILLVSLRRTAEMNKKMDLILKEEKKATKSLALTKLEEDEQLALMKTMIKEMSELDKITRKEHEGMQAVERLAKKASSKSGKSSPLEMRRALAELENHIKSLNDISSREDKQLALIGNILKKSRR